MLVLVLLVIVVLNPILLYAHKSTVQDYTIFHDKPLDTALNTRLREATALVQKSELYVPSLHLEICMNDGSVYPALMERVRGRAFGWGYVNKVCLRGDAMCAGNFDDLGGYKWNLTQLLAHEAMHCYQFKARGFWGTNPMAGFPTWKWEGYPEYVARQVPTQKDLQKNIKRLLKTEATDNNGWILFEDSTGTNIQYYKYWLLVQYCMDIKRMSYKQILADTAQEGSMNAQMMDWYQQQPQ